jgi:hypothetical protein
MLTCRAIELRGRLDAAAGEQQGENDRQGVRLEDSGFWAE